METLTAKTMVLPGIFCARLTIKLGLDSPESYEDEFPEFALIDFAFYLQLTPEMAEDISAYEYVCFVDAHTGQHP